MNVYRFTFLVRLRGRCWSVSHAIRGRYRPVSDKNYGSFHGKVSVRIRGRLWSVSQSVEGFGPYQGKIMFLFIGRFWSVSEEGFGPSQWKTLVRLTIRGSFGPYQSKVLVHIRGRLRSSSQSEEDFVPCHNQRKVLTRIRGRFWSVSEENFGPSQWNVSRHLSLYLPSLNSTFSLP